MNAEQQAAWTAFEAALDAWLVAPSAETECALDAAWLHFHRV